MTEIRCANCCFFKVTGRNHGDDEIQFGDCRVGAPRFDISKDFGVWPWVTESDWCGEFEPGPAPGAAALPADDDDDTEDEMAGLGALFG